MPSKAGKTHEEARRQSRGALLRAGAEIFVEDTTLNPFTSLTARAICERAGYSTGAFFRQWPHMDRFYRELGEYLLSGEVVTVPADFEELIRLAEAEVSKEKSPLAVLTAVAEADFQALVDSPLWDANELLNVSWARGPLRETAVRGYRKVDRETERLYGIVLAKLDREPVPPLNISHLAVLLQALVEGLGLRHRVDPEVVETADSLGSRIYSVGAAALITSLTRPRTDRSELQQTLADALNDDSAQPEST